MVEVFTTGGIILDNVVAADGTVHLETLGGNAVYAAAGARLWSSAVGCVGVVPRNYPAEGLRAMADAGLDLSGVHHAAVDVECPEWFFHRPDGSRVDQVHAPTGALAAFSLAPDRIAPADARRFEDSLRERADQGRGFGAFRADHPVEPSHAPTAFWNGARGVHLAPNRIDAQRRLAIHARTRGLTVSLDPGRQAETITAADLDAVLTTCDVFLPSEKELRILAAGEEPAHAVALLSQRGAALVAAKLGGRGSILHDRRSGTCLAVPALPVEAPDPTGAGDAFCGGFLAAFVRTSDPVLAACCGTVSASFAVEAFGPFRLLGAGAAEIEGRLRHILSQVPEFAGAAALDALLQRRPG